MNDYRSRLRSSPRQNLQDATLLPNMSGDDLDFGFPVPSFASSPSPRKNRLHHELGSPHKSGYYLRTPSPMRKLQNFLNSPLKTSPSQLPGTPSPHKPSSATDLFGNKSLLDNLDVPDDWDENFLDGFQDDWLTAIGTEDLESLNRSPLKSPGRGQTFLPNSTKNASPAVSPFKSPLLTSSPKKSVLSPLWGKTPAVIGGRPVTRQRKLFLNSPERHTAAPHQQQQPSNPVAWNAPLPFSSLHDVSSSSILSDGLESTTSLHSISSYLKNLDDEEVQDDLPVMPPVGWTSKSGKGVGSRIGKSGGKGTSSSSSKSKRDKKVACGGPQVRAETQQSFHQHGANSTALVAGNSQTVSGGKKVKIEPQFTLLRPHTELRTHQISLRTTPVTPPNKIKISRDFSQIQTLPSKEQLRIVRTRFTETLNKAVEQVIEREKSKRTQSSSSASSSSTPTIPTAVPPAPSQLVQPSAPQFLPHSLPVSVPMQVGLPIPTGIPQAVIAMKPPPSKRRKR